MMPTGHTFRTASGREIPAQGRQPFAKFLPDRARKPLPPECLTHYWYPEREGVEPAPARIQAKLAAIHPGLAICRPPANAPTPSHAWACWYRKPEITHWLSPGWFLFFVWQERREVPNKEQGLQTILTPLDLDDARLIANIYRFSVYGDFKNAKAHFEGVRASILAEKQRVAKADADRRHALTGEFWQSTAIKNIGAGSKFARHHDGSVVPSRGDLAWTEQRGDRDLPGELQAEAKDKRRRRELREKRRR